MGHTLRKQDPTSQTGSHLEKLGHTLENGSQLEKWLTIRKMGHTIKKSGSHFKKLVTPGKRSILNKWVKVEKFVTLRKIG